LLIWGANTEKNSRIMIWRIKSVTGVPKEKKQMGRKKLRASGGGQGVEVNRVANLGEKRSLGPLEPV